jgi:hypothetical protein
MALKKQAPETRVVANFRSAAKSNLEQFLKTDVDRICSLKTASCYAKRRRSAIPS